MKSGVQRLRGRGSCRRGCKGRSLVKNEFEDRSKRLGYCESYVRTVLQGDITGSLAEQSIEPLDFIDSPGPDTFRDSTSINGFRALGAGEAVHGFKPRHLLRWSKRAPQPYIHSSLSGVPISKLSGETNPRLNGS